jgi:molybdopterin-guanine dinucleotide biosynthesis protein A
MSDTAALGVLLAGGRGRRLGLAVPKALATLGGRTFLERALEALHGACDQVVVAVPPSFDLALAGAARVDDVAADAGPLAGMIAGLGSRPFTRAIVLGVDYPLMRADVLRDMLRTFDDERTRTSELDARIPVVENRPQPLCAVYAPTSVAILKDHFVNGGRTVMEAIDRLRTVRPVVQGGDVVAFTHVNTPDDLARAGSLAESVR